MNACNHEHDEDVAVGMSGALGPRDMAAAVVKRPGLYIGFPPTPERAEAFIQGFDMALLLTSGEGAPLAQYRALLHPNPEHDTATAERDAVDLTSLLPVIEELFTAARASSRRGSADDAHIPIGVSRRAVLARFMLMSQQIAPIASPGAAHAF